MTSGIDITHDDGVVILTLANPAKRNAVTAAMYGQLGTALTQAANDPAIRVALIRADGDDFCAGNDISMLASSSTGDLDIGAAGTSDFLDTLSTFPKPLIASVRGRAIGIGVTLLLHCDLVYIASDASLRTPFVDLGLVPEAASGYLLPARIGHVRAFALFSLGEAMSGEEAARLGIANRALPAGEVDQAALAAAKVLAGKSMSSLAATKRLMRDSQAIAAALAADSDAFVKQLSSPEAIAAFAAFFTRQSEKEVVPKPMSAAAAVAAAVPAAGR